MFRAYKLCANNHYICIRVYVTVNFSNDAQLNANICRKFNSIKICGGFEWNRLPARKCDIIAIMVLRERVLYQNFGCKRELGIITAEIVTLSVE